MWKSLGGSGSVPRRRPTRKELCRRGFRTASARHRPDAARSRSSLLPLLGYVRAVRRRRHPDTTDTRTSRHRLRRNQAPGGTSNISTTATGDTVTDGAMTAPEPNHSPINAAGGAARAGRRPREACSTAGALPRSPSRSIRIDPACQTSRAISRDRNPQQLVGVAHRIEVGDLAVDDLDGKTPSSWSPLYTTIAGELL